MDKGNHLKLIPFFLVTGFLGSGKTTFLKRVLEQFSEKTNIGIIQNEFASINVDSQDLSQTGKSFKLLEINRGAVFCICLLADFKSGCAEFIKKHQPDILFLEASGLSDPIAIVQILGAQELKDLLYLSTIWCIVDAVTFLQLEKSNVRLAHQIRVADVVFVNKIDKGGKNKREIAKRILEINPLARISYCQYCDTEIELSKDNIEPLAIRESQNISKIEPLTRPHIGTATIKSTRKISKKQLESFLHMFLDKAYRIKGHVQLGDESAVIVQSTFGSIEIEILNGYIGPSELVAIGPGIDAKEFSAQFRAFCQ